MCCFSEPESYFSKLMQKTTCMSRVQCYAWFERFKWSILSMDKDHCFGRPSTTINDGTPMLLNLLLLLTVVQLCGIELGLVSVSITQFWVKSLTCIALLQILCLHSSYTTKYRTVSTLAKIALYATKTLWQES